MAMLPNFFFYYFTHNEHEIKWSEMKWKKHCLESIYNEDEYVGIDKFSLPHPIF